MSLLPLFSRRKRQSERSGPDVYSYDNFPHNVRVQVVHILNKAIGPLTNDSGYSYAPGNEVYKFLVETFREELGVFYLTQTRRGDFSEEFFQWILEERNTDRLIDGFELALQTIDTHVRNNVYQFREYITKNPDVAIAEFNARLNEASIGYHYANGSIIPVISTFLHKEVVLPALSLLSNPIFVSAEQEYLAAHTAFRHGDFETCLVECAKAFESVLKVIAKKRAWPVDQSANAKKLLDVAYSQDFVAKELQAEFSSLRGLLESAVPTVRNKLAAHGAGEKPRNLPAHLAAFQLHQTASVIAFLAAQDGVSNS